MNWSSDANTSDKHTLSSSPHETLKYVTLVLYLITFMAGLFGNSLVMYILLRFKDVRSKSVANIYILNLSIADLIFILTLPLFCYATFTNDWIFGNVMCTIAYVLREINKFGSIFTLMALSIDRFLASYSTLSYLRTNKVGKIVCLCVWVASLAMCTPYIMYSYTVETGGKYKCKINWPIQNQLAHLRVWSYSQLVLGLLAPIAVIIVSYALLLKRLKAIMRFRQSHASSKKPNRRMTRTILFVVIIFILCQVPYYVMDLLSVAKIAKIQNYGSQGKQYTPSPMEWQLFVYFNALAQMLVFISSCCNPIIYGITNENFRELYKEVLCCGQQGCNRDRYLPTATS